MGRKKRRRSWPTSMAQTRSLPSFGEMRAESAGRSRAGHGVGVGWLGRKWKREQGRLTCEAGLSATQARRGGDGLLLGWIAVGFWFGSA